MSRTLTAEFAEAMTATVVQPILLFEAEFTSGAVYLWTGIGDLYWNSLTWVGIGSLVGVAPIEETDSLKANGVAITLKGVSPADLSLMLSELRRGKPGSIRLGLFENGYELGEGVDYIGEASPEMILGMRAGGLIEAPKIIFKGRLDVGGIDDSDPTAPIVLLTYEHQLIDLERPREWRYTDKHQVQLYPDDKGLIFVASLQDTELVWGRR